ncbi:MAG: threonine synthase [Eubacterium sp.]|nr:threonine synthase [Eubacterium sp.]
MKYRSTRGSEILKTAPQGIIQGLAEDKGLYVPVELPNLPFKIEDVIGKSYQEIALEILRAFFPDFTEEEMKKCVYGAYDEKFEAEEIVPVVPAAGVNFLELYHGKTAAFKDMALSILPYLLTTSIKKENEDKKICILAATSGDTGKAALEGFADVPGTEIIVFYPNEGVSEVQERQMVTQEGENTHVYAINGNFDHAQSGVKQIFNDDEMAKVLEEKGVKLSSANSINIGRLVPQVAYYVYAYVKMVESNQVKCGEPINVVVPTGNFGNILAAFYAYKMGIPMNKFICASNENKVLTDFINTGIYDIRRDFHLTNSPSMDILISSNLERLLFNLSGDNGEEIKELMINLEENKVYQVSDKIKEGLDKYFYGGFATVDETNEVIGRVYKEDNYLMDTHTAVAYKVYESYKAETGDTTPAVIASTASPYKFADSVAKAIGVKECNDGFEYVKEVNAATSVAIPAGLKDLDKKEIRHTGVLDVEEMPKSVLDLF